MNARDEDSARSHASAGILYIASGGAVLTFALMLMRHGVTSIFWTRGRFLLPVEFIAGIAGIVVFMGLVQLLLAFIRKMRERR